MKDNTEFRTNPLINSIKDEESWTISTNDKMPVDMKYLIETARVRGASFKESNPLSTLDIIDSYEELEPFNRTYRFHARDNNIIIIDIEKTANEETKEFFKKIPVDYGEVSMSGKGIHLMLKVPDECITNEGRYLFEDMSVLKILKGTVEIIFNDHYCTLTKRQIPIIEKDENNEQHLTIIRNLIETLVKEDKDSKKKREEMRKISINYEDKENHPKVCEEIIETAVRNYSFDKDIDDYDDDYSRYEAACAVKAMNIVLTMKDEIMKNKKTSISYNEIKDLSESDLVYIGANVLRKNIPYREKHDQERNNIPWLTYITINAYKYIKSKEARERSPR